MINRFISILLSLVLIINLSMTNGFIYANENDNNHLQVEENSYTTEESEVESTTEQQENNEQSENYETTIIESSQNDNSTVNDFHNNENVINENEVEDNDIVEPFAVDDENNNNDYEEEPEDDIVEDDINTSDNIENDNNLNNIDTNGNETDIESTTVEEISNEASNATENNEESTIETLTTSTENDTTNESTITETTSDETINTTETSNETVAYEETTNTSYETTTTENSTTATDETTIATEESTVENTTTDTTTSTEIVNVATSSDIVDEDILNTALFGDNNSYKVNFNLLPPTNTTGNIPDDLKTCLESHSQTLSQLTKNKDQAFNPWYGEDYIAENILGDVLKDKYKLAFWTYAKNYYGLTDHPNNTNQSLKVTKNTNVPDNNIDNNTNTADVYAVWNVKITFDNNGHGTVNPTSQWIQLDARGKNVNYEVKNAPSKNIKPLDNVDGYTFVGWSKNPQPDTTYDNTAVYKKNNADDPLKTDTENYFKANEPMTLYAVWEEESYDVTLDLTVTTEGTKINDDDNYEQQNESGTRTSKWKLKNKRKYSDGLTLPIPQRTGYTFKGWKANSGSTTYTTRIPANTKVDKKYIAEWEANTYTIHYNLNGGSFSNANVKNSIVYDREDYTISPDPSRTGYDFKGWYENSDFSGDPLSDNKIPKDKAKNWNLYAKWEEKQYSIKYYISDNTEVSSLTEQNKKIEYLNYTAPVYKYYSEEIVLPTVNEMKNNGLFYYDTNNNTNNTKNHFFTHWALKDDTKISKLEANKDYSNGSNNEIELYAKYVDVYHVYLKNYKGTTGRDNDVDFYVIQNSIIDENYHKPTLENNKFAGWYTGSDKNKKPFDIVNTRITGSLVDSNKKIEITAEWENGKTTHKVTFKDSLTNQTKPTDINNMPSEQYVVDGEKAIKPKDPTAFGYRFVDWLNENDDSFDFDAPIQSNANIYAKWELIDWNIKYHLNGGAWANGYNPHRKYNISNRIGVGDGVITLPKVDESNSSNDNITKNHYKFKGWYKSPTFAGTSVTDLSGSTGDLNLYAKWELNESDQPSKYINFSPNGGSGYMTTQCVFNDDTNIKLQKNEYTYAGYQFAGWTSSDGTTKYIDQAEIETSKLTGENIVLTANWTPIPKKSSFPSYSGSSYYGGGSGGSGGGGGGGGSYSVHYPTINNNNPMIVQNQAVTTEQPMLIGFNNSTKEQKVNQVKWTSGIIDERTSKWVANPQTGKWQIYNKDGVKATNGFYQVNNIAQIGFTQQMISDTYYFDSLGQMVTGFVTTQDNKCYYFETANNQNQGKMVRGWKQINGDYYYFNQDGSMVVNGITPDGRAVGQDGKLLKFNM